MRYFKAGNYLDQGTYRSFIPSFINREWTVDDMQVLSLLSKADRMLGRLDMFSEHIPNIDLFIAMHIAKEECTADRWYRTCRWRIFHR